MRIVKRVIAFIFSIILILSVAACSKALVPNKLLDGANPENSALSLYLYDGIEIRRVDIFFPYDVVDTLSAVKTRKAVNWSINDITLPIYGIATNGIFAAWSNGYWIAQDGNIYSFDFDFSKLAQESFRSRYDKIPSFSVFPCARLLSLDENGWNNTLLTPTELNPPDGIVMTLESWDNDSVTVNITNNSRFVWTYGEFFSIQVLLDGVWCDVPILPDWYQPTPAIGYGLSPGETTNKTYYLQKYGELPEGIYRLVVENVSVTNKNKTFTFHVTDSEVFQELKQLSDFEREAVAVMYLPTLIVNDQEVYCGYHKTGLTAVLYTNEEESRELVNFTFCDVETAMHEFPSVGEARVLKDYNGMEIYFRMTDICGCIITSESLPEDELVRIVNSFTIRRGPPSAP